MKKLLTIGFAAAMMFAMAGKASATPLETSGELRARYWFLGNYVASGTNAEWWDSRLRLTLVWPVAENVKVTARADINEGFWGDRVETATKVPATATEPETTKYAADANPRKAVDWDQLNLSFVWPNTPITIVVGRQTTTWGPGFFVSQDHRDRFRIGAKVSDFNLFYTYDKYGEVGTLHETSTLDDWSQHTVGFTSLMAGWNYGAIVALVQNATTLNTEVSRWVVDGYGMGKVGPVDLKAEAVWGFGKDDNTGKPDVDASGLGIYVGATMPAGPVTAGLEFAYVAGDDPSTTDKNEGAFASDYQSPFWSIILFNSLDYNGYANESVTGPAPSDSGMKNAWGTKLSCSAAPMQGLTLYGAAVYASRLEDVKNATTGVVTPADPLGIEIDITATYAITPNVSWTVGGGFLVAGNYFGDMKDPWGLMSAFTVKF